MSDSPTKDLHGGIVQEPTPVLRQKAREVTKKEFDSKELRAILKKMSNALHTQPDGVAIAAPQIGVSLRIFLVRGYIMAGQVDLPREERDDTIPDAVFINPVITKLSRKKEALSEGCLSVRGIWGTVHRSVQTRVRAYDEHGAQFEYGGSGLLAQAFQHETDHLDGVLFIDKADEVHKHVPKKKTHNESES